MSGTPGRPGALLPTDMTRTMTTVVFMLFPFASADIAVVGQLFGNDAPVAALEHAITTNWTLVDAGNATSAQIAAATAFVEVPPSLLSGASSGKLYQFAFTGIPDSMLAAVPARFTVANCHQSTVPIAEYVLASALEWTVQLRTMEARLRNW